MCGRLWWLASKGCLNKGWDFPCKPMREVFFSHVTKWTTRQNGLRGKMDYETKWPFFVWCTKKMTINPFYLSGKLSTFIFHQVATMLMATIAWVFMLENHYQQDLENLESTLNSEENSSSHQPILSFEVFDLLGHLSPRACYAFSYEGSWSLEQSL